MEKDEKITLWSERIHEFQSSGQTCKTWCQEHHVPVSTMNYWMHKLKFKLDPYSRCMFAFCNRRRTSIKILQWDGSGFWILMKRLDRDSFHWPETPDELQKVTMKEMHWLCDGLSLTPKGAFEERHPKIVV